MSYNIRI